MLRTSPDRSQTVLALTNVTSVPQRAAFRAGDLDAGSATWQDILTSRMIEGHNERVEILLQPYEVLWLTSSVGGRAAG